MRPMRSSWGGFGGPVGLESVGARLALGIVVGSVLVGLLPGQLGIYLLLTPGLVLSPTPALWQFLTYAFVAQGTLGVIFGALIAWQLGGALAQTWGSRRTLLFALGTTAAAGVLTVLLSLVVPVLRGMSYPGATVLTSVLWVAFGLSWGRGQTGFWGLPVTGNTLALIGVGIVFLDGIFSGWPVVVPSAFGIALTWAYLRLGSPRMAWLRLRSWQLERQLRGGSRRRNHLRVVGRDDEERPRDRYLN